MSKSTCELITMQNYDILPFRVSLLEHPVLNCSELFRIVLICSELFSSAPEGSVDAYKVADTWKDFFNIEPTGINRVEADASAAGWYSINGQRSSSARKGLNIMRTADGKIRKVIIR